MAKKNMGESYSKATINKAEGTITEYLPKDVVNVYSLQDIIDAWDGIEGIALTIKKDSEIEPKE